MVVFESGINKYFFFFLSYFFKCKMEGSVFFCEEFKVMVYINFEDDEFFGDCFDVVCEVN